MNRTGAAAPVDRVPVVVVVGAVEDPTARPVGVVVAGLVVDVVAVDGEEVAFPGPGAGPLDVAVPGAEVVGVEDPAVLPLVSAGVEPVSEARRLLYFMPGALWPGASPAPESTPSSKAAAREVLAFEPAAVAALPRA